MKSMQSLLINKKTVTALILMGISALVGSFIVLKRHYDTIQSIDSQASYDLSTVVNATPKPDEDIQTLEYSLVNGWNFVSFPLETLAFKTAAGLINDIASNGGFVSTVSSWDGDRWLEFTQSGNKQYGLDFPIVPGKAYFLRSHETYAWKVIGLPLTSLPETKLQKGWNAIGITGSSLPTAETVLDSISQGNDIAREIDWWQSGSWDVFVKRIYAPDNVKVYGNNFAVDTTKGYMINVTEDTMMKGAQ
jgi:hypothetical protein